ncbi:VOC family protein [Nocardia sp. CA-290969]|uniref:VOC family protein n=1 Tax=Nocardia sp. CA-290969 TaxID=3239986 RepID=UPI003D933510
MDEADGDTPFFCQIKIVASDLSRSLEFYRLLGAEFEVSGGHAAATLPNGTVFEIDEAPVVAGWDSGWNGTTGGSTVLGFSVGTSDAVDRLHRLLSGAGRCEHLAPHDAPWGRRLAIVDDPDGNPVAIMGPQSPEARPDPVGSGVNSG